MKMKKVKKYLSMCTAIIFIFYVIPLNISFMGRKFSNIQVAKASTTSINAAEDISIDNNAQWGLGQGGKNYIGRNGKNCLLYERSAIKFDLSLIPSAADISSVNLKIYVDDILGSPIVNIMSATDNTWSESAVGIGGNTGTFPQNNGKDVTETNGGTIINGIANQRITTSGWNSFDVTQYIKDQYTAGNRYVTIVLTGKVSDGINTDNDNDDFGYVCNNQNDQNDPNYNRVPNLDLVYTTAPTVSSVSPAKGPTAGGTSVTITGTNFTGATAVNFGANNATSYTVNGATQITAVAPSGAAGTVDIKVTTAGGTSATGASDDIHM